MIPNIDLRPLVVLAFIGLAAVLVGVPLLLWWLLSHIAWVS